MILFLFLNLLNINFYYIKIKILEKNLKKGKNK